MKEKEAAKLFMVHKQKDSMVEVKERYQCTPDSEGFNWNEAEG